MELGHTGGMKHVYLLVVGVGLVLRICMQPDLGAASIFVSKSGPNSRRRRIVGGWNVVPVDAGGVEPSPLSGLSGMARTTANDPWKGVLRARPRLARGASDIAITVPWWRRSRRSRRCRWSRTRQWGRLQRCTSSSQWILGPFLNAHSAKGMPRLVRAFHRVARP